MHPSKIVPVGACVCAGCGGLWVFPRQTRELRNRGERGNSGTGGVTGIGNFGGTTSGQGGLTGQGGGQECGARRNPSSKLPPDILIVLDASGSMNEDATNTRAATAVAARTRSGR